MLLHLGGPTGASLAVCDAACARVTVHQLGIRLRAVTNGRPAPAGYCRHCVACGGITDEPITRRCWRHPDGCPTWDYRYTATAALVLRRITTERNQILDEEGMRLMEQVLADLADGPEGLDAELAYRRLIVRLPPRS